MTRLDLTGDFFVVWDSVRFETLVGHLSRGAQLGLFHDCTTTLEYFFLHRSSTDISTPLSLNQREHIESMLTYIIEI